jgi:hypothetical protein
MNEASEALVAALRRIDSIQDQFAEGPLGGILARDQQGNYAKELRQEALDDFNSRPAALFAHYEPMTAVEKLFALPFPADAMRDVISQIEANPPALAGVRAAVRDYMILRVGVEIERHPAFCIFLDRHREELQILFGIENLAVFDDIAGDLRRQAQTQDAQFSGTPNKQKTAESSVRTFWNRLFGRAG